ncbi:PDR/VanB family oxidoreductase [Nocardia terpenica]|uniref:2Fe-2S iron-sulfur cluster binding domain-containing protein n=1 Tax=Nocardia terpenica TaxID=455432 RepID=A0A6G9Z7N3_9NOCA|nr:PDR/VanB family oxidoreductase [Nocardia terpenica]QIS21411.1 2Fe-2S iron-sulfur cluster binding domain-containing protein [Nocardia terpenica]
MSTAADIRAAIPPDLYGRHDRDRLLRAVHLAVQAMMALLRVSPPPPPTPPARRDRHPVRVARRYDATPDGTVVALEFERTDGVPLPAWHPGAHIDLTLPSGTYRQYSLCGDPADRHRYRIAVRRIDNGRGGSREIHARLTEGVAFGIGTPRNAFPFAVGGDPLTRRPVRFIAGGIGITPILPMLHAATALELPWSLVYAGRDRASLPLLDEIESFGPHTSVHLDSDHGTATPAHLLTGITDNTIVYCCGPAPMIDAVKAVTATMPGVDLFSERFNPPPIIGGEPFDITLTRTGEVIHVPADRSALDILLEHRPHLPYSCRQGFCHSCRLDTADGPFQPCVDRPPARRIELDL